MFELAVFAAFITAGLVMFLAINPRFLHDPDTCAECARANLARLDQASRDRHPSRLP